MSHQQSNIKHSYSQHAWLSRVIIIVMTLVCLTWLFFQADTVSELVHINYTQLLHDQREAEAKVNNEVLANSMALARNYDALVLFIDKLQSVNDQITKPPKFLSQKDSEKLIDQAYKIQLTLKKKLILIDLFKRNNSILNNSQNYFNEISNSLLIDSNSLLIETYVRYTMLFLQAPEEKIIKDLELIEQQVIKEEFQAETQKTINNLLLHGQLIKKYKLKVDEQLREMMSLPFVQQQGELIRLYSQGHSNAVMAQEQYRILLYVLALLLTLYLAYIFIHLEYTRRSLVEAHKEVSERYLAQKKAEKLLKLHDTAFNSAHEGITLTDADGNIITVNPAFTRITGYQYDEVVGKNPRVLKSGRHDTEFYQSMWKSILETGNWLGEIWNKNKFGEIYPELLSITSVYDTAGAVTNYVAVFSDISRLKEQEKQLKKMAYYDALTQLPNRLLLIDRMTQGILHTQRTDNFMAVCYLDLDGFKPVNDTYGHEAGDHLLVEMANRFTSTLRGGDTVARLGGDEFVFLLLGLERFEEYKHTLQRLLKAITQVIPINGNLISLTASIGVTLYPSDKSDSDSLLRHADQAMYQAKQQGKNTYHLFDPKKDTLVRGQYHQISLIENALQLDEFVIYYQPKVDLRKGSVVGLEALIRWQHPEQGLVPPIDFLPAIESHELIVQIGNWVIETVLMQMEYWKSKGLDLQVSVNVASYQLQQPDFVEQLKKALSRHPDINANLLELEILETVALEDIVNVSKVIEECQELGVSFALDDFGTGYSSLTYLKRLPVSTLKIDRSFILGMLSDPEDLAIVHSVLALTNAFKKHAIAEGAETYEHCRMLLQLGCQYAQGYGISRPMPADDVQSWVCHWQPHPLLKKYQKLFWNDVDYPILAAEVDHKSWINVLIHSVNEGLSVTHKSISDYHFCRFGQWYYGVGQRYMDEPAYKNIEEIHKQIHLLSEKIAVHCQSGDFERAKELLPKLLLQRDEILELLKQLSLELAIKYKQ